MFFYADVNISGTGGIRTSIITDVDTLPANPDQNTLYIQTGKQRLITLEVSGGKLLLLGDPVYAPGTLNGKTIVTEPGKIDLEALYNVAKGHYNWFYMTEDALLAGQSFGAVFPVYYRQDRERTVFCSDAFTLAERTDAGAPDKRNLLERLLFNYPFFGSTWWEHIRLLESHRYLHLSSDKVAVDGGFEVSDYFSAPEDTSRDSLPTLADLFQEECRLFFPEKNFGISLTGGFDGRTLVAAARHDHRDFFAYSFGRPDSSDVTLPARQAKALGIPYTPVLLDEKYVDASSLESGWAFMQKTGFNGNFGRPHYLHAARQLAEKTEYILTGNFGSELFRALHLPGVMMSESLIRIFSAGDDSWKDHLIKASATWDGTFFREETEALIADIDAYIARMKGWEANHKFYYFVFNEIFRKYFGPELVMQSHFLNNRTPYLNLHFFRQLNRTIWSGVHSRLFEKTKSKRMKGQQFYATFIRRSDPSLYHMNTNKGYSPADVTESWRLPFLLGKVLAHRYLFYKDIDDNSVSSFFSKFHPQIAANVLDGSLPAFLSDRINTSLSEIPHLERMDEWVKIYSIASGWSMSEKIGQQQPAR
ncbi:MAG: hypothetical protein H6575_16330 [Lewinellaceae bacterium]|nr:hypothetical protein [Lewinellaceae bacterium]